MAPWVKGLLILSLICFAASMHYGEYTGFSSLRKDGRCGKDYRAPNGGIGECRPRSKNYCCSNRGWCGHTKAHCDCHTCVNYRKPTVAPTMEPAVEPTTANGCLASANYYRQKQKNTPNLKWSAFLAEKAQAYADYLLKRASTMSERSPNILVHDKANRKNGWGENLYYMNNWKTGDDVFYCKAADKSWYAEIDNYSWETTLSTNGRPTGHFTQMVWKSTKNVGYGVAVGDSRLFKGNKIAFVVAKYTPPGNMYMRGQRVKYYRDNVEPLKGY